MIEEFKKLTPEDRGLWIRSLGHLMGVVLSYLILTIFMAMVWLPLGVGMALFLLVALFL